MSTTPEFKTLAEVTQAVERGAIVCWKNEAYTVHKSTHGDWYVTYDQWSNNPNTVGLFWTDGVNSEYDAADFFTLVAA